MVCVLVGVRRNRAEEAHALLASGGLRGSGSASTTPMSAGSSSLARPPHTWEFTHSEAVDGDVAASTAGGTGAGGGSSGRGAGTQNDDSGAGANAGAAAGGSSLDQLRGSLYAWLDAMAAHLQRREEKAAATRAATLAAVQRRIQVRRARARALASVSASTASMYPQAQARHMHAQHGATPSTTAATAAARPPPSVGAGGTPAGTKRRVAPTTSNQVGRGTCAGAGDARAGSHARLGTVGGRQAKRPRVAR